MESGGADNGKLIFVSNDDGMNVGGFRAVIELLRPFGRIVAVVPSGDRSGTSQAFSFHTPVTIRHSVSEPGLEVYECSGTPVDCVKLSFDHMFRDMRPDLCVAGINHGSNSAINALYSGTVGAAIEASLYHIPTLALSVCSHSPDVDFSAAVRYLTPLVGRILSGGPYPSVYLLNVNVPVLPEGEIRGYRLCRQGAGCWHEHFTPVDPSDPDSGFGMRGDFVNWEPDDPQTDNWALANGYISVVPMRPDMTAYEHMDVTAGLLEEPSL